MAERGWTLLVPELEALATAPGPAGRKLARWLARGRAGRLPRPGIHAAIGWALTGDPDAERRWPPGPITWRADFGSAPPAGVLRLDPVHMDPSGARVAMLSGDGLRLGLAEARTLGDAIAAELGPGTEFRVGAATRWYLRPRAAPAGEWVSPDRLAEGDAVSALPRGGGGLGPLMASAEMVLHAHPANEARRAAGLPEVNGVWPWGWGPADTVAEPCAATLVVAAHPYAVGLARVLGARVEAGAAPPPGAVAERGMVLWDTRDPDALLDAWIRHLGAALARGRIRRLRVADERGRYVELRRGDPWRFWRRAPAW